VDRVKENKSSIKQFESEHGKIVTLLKLGKIVIKTESINAIPGEFPITEWRSFPLEIPASGSEKHIIGRFPGGLHVEPTKDVSQVINLPVYTGEDICDAGIFENFPTDLEKVREISKVPVVSVATKTCGQYSDGRLLQSLSVLPIWKDGLSIVLELDWSEGNSMEDAVNPEWFIRASPTLPVKEGLQKLKKCFKLPPLAEKCSHYLYVNPSSLGTHVLGEGQECPSMTWPCAWKYEECEKMLNALDRLAENLLICFGDDLCLHTGKLKRRYK
jgi:hypothetical protein